MSDGRRRSRRPCSPIPIPRSSTARCSRCGTARSPEVRSPTVREGSPRIAIVRLVARARGLRRDAARRRPRRKSCGRCSSRRSPSAPPASAAVFAGEVKPRHEADLGFRIGGKVVARTVDVGARVKKGQVLARLDPADVGLQAEAAKAQVAADRDRVPVRAGRVRALPEPASTRSSSAPPRSTPSATRSTPIARSSSRRRRSSPSRRTRRATRRCVANEDGVVTAVNAEPGQVVTAGQSVVRIAREDEREVAISVPENRIGELKNGRQLVVVLWAQPGKQYRGTRARGLARRRSRRRARSPCACRSTTPMPPCSGA